MLTFCPSVAAGPPRAIRWFRRTMDRTRVDEPVRGGRSQGASNGENNRCASKSLIWTHLVVSDWQCEKLRLLPGPPRTPARTAISQRPTNCPAFGGLLYSVPISEETGGAHSVVIRPRSLRPRNSVSWETEIGWWRLGSNVAITARSGRACDTGGTIRRAVRKAAPRPCHAGGARRSLP